MITFVSVFILNFACFIILWYIEVKTAMINRAYQNVMHTRDNSTHGHHQIVNNKIRLIILFAVKDGEALRCQQKQDQGLTLTQIMNSLLQISDLN